MSSLSAEILAGLRDGSIVPYLGPGALAGSVDLDDGTPIPADSDSLILAMNDGRPMAPKLMYEFPRAAMNMELKKGRNFVNRFLNCTYGQRRWRRAPLHDWLTGIRPPYVIDTNRDTQLLETYRNTPHTLVQGIARIGGTDFRFRLFDWNGSAYRPIEPGQVNAGQPTLFKPLGCPTPESSFIASDADFVDYLTELMGGFAIPEFLKRYRAGKRYLLLGVRLTRDTERMLMSDITYGARAGRGWAVIVNPTDKERRFCLKMGLNIIEAPLEAVFGTQPVTV